VRTRVVLGAWALAAGAGSRVVAQEPVTRAAAVSAALARGARAALARTDTAAARGALHAARLYPNPSVAASYSQDLPHNHLLVSMPLDLPWLRAPRVGTAAAARAAALDEYALERAAIRCDIDTTYTQALTALAHARLSRRNAVDADTLLQVAELRRAVGDVADLDVRLAEVNAGQLANAAESDSLAAVEAVLAVQLAMGLPAEQPTITLADSLAPPPDTALGGAGEPLRVAAAGARLAAQEAALSLARRSALATPSVQVGFDQGDPTGPRGLEPVLGISLPLPLFNWNGGEVAQAEAARARARAALDLAERMAAAERAAATRRLSLALVRLTRDQRLLDGARRVAAMALQAYAEGAVPLADVLEAERNARDALGRYIDDVGTANDGLATARLVAATAEP